MSDESLKQSEDATPVDPFEAELVAYLDGELDGDAARRVEVRLAADPAARARASALKKTFDLLDYLPKPDPSPTFTTRTLDKIPALRSGSRPVVLASPSHPIPSVQAAAGRTSPPLSASTSAPIALSEELPRGKPVHPHRSWTWPAGLAAALVALIAIGYLGAIALRPYLFPPVAPRDPASDDLADHRLIEDLPLYAVVDDYEFVERLADSGLFASDVMPAVRPQAAIQTVEPERPGTPGFIALARAFKSLPPARQETIRDIDRRLYAQPQATRDRLFRALEAYAVWLDRLPETDRNGVLGAAPDARIGLVREIRERQWIEALPAAQRNQLTSLDPKQKGERIRQWKAEVKRQGDQWAFVRKNADAVAGNKVPWPFDTSAGRRDVIEFVRVALRTDDPKKCRMTTSELNEYISALSAAEKSGAWAAYGKMVYDLDNRHESLPESANPKLMYTDFAELPGMYSKITDRIPGLKRKLAPHMGKWPDFPLELHDELRLGKLGPIQLPPLGPARLSEFKEPVRSFIEKEVLSQLTQQERGSMRFVENRWPDYPRRIVEFARIYDVSIPGIMLPGPPRMWEATYGSQVRPMRK